MTFRILPRNPVTVPPVQKGPLQNRRLKKKKNRAPGMGITPSLEQGNPLKAPSEPGKVGTREQAANNGKTIIALYFVI